MPYSRWSNHSRFFAVSSPVPQRAYSCFEIYVGRFSEDYRSVEAWTRPTEDDRPDVFPDVRIVLEVSSVADRAIIVGGDSSERTGSLQAKGRLIEKTPTPHEISSYRSTMATYPSELRDGETFLFAHWVIHDGRVIRGFRRKIGETYPLNLVVYDGNLDYQGQRFVSSIEEGSDVVYEDVCSDQ